MLQKVLPTHPRQRLQALAQEPSSTQHISGGGQQKNTVDRLSGGTHVADASGVRQRDHLLGRAPGQHLVAEAVAVGVHPAAVGQLPAGGTAARAGQHRLQKNKSRGSAGERMQGSVARGPIFNLRQLTAPFG
jgi:hypothetical protein